MYAGVRLGEACGHSRASEAILYGGMVAPGVRLALPVWGIEVAEISPA